MKWNRQVAAMILATGATVVGPVIGGFSAVQAACEAGDRVDSSTADQARKKIEAAGYTQVSELKKGCDNFWHGFAFKDGVEKRVVLSPSGVVVIERN